MQSTLPQFSIPKSNPASIKPSSTPGPGSYEPKINDTNEYNSIGLAKDHRRPFYDEKKGVPGPGSYNHSPIIEKAPAYKYFKDYLESAIKNVDKRMLITFLVQATIIFPQRFPICQNTTNDIYIIIFIF